MRETRVQQVPSVLYLFPHPLEPILDEIAAGRAPSERAYGFLELRAHGWQVGYSDHRHRRGWARLFAVLNRFVRLLDPGTLRTIARYDIVLVKDEFSLLLTILARLMGCKVVYLDAMFAYPRRLWRRLSCWLNVRLASSVVCYSRTQAEEWAHHLGVPASRFDVVPYGMDVPFYEPVHSEPQQPYVLAVGRDPGRDFLTLLEALEGTRVGLKLITLPYLLPSRTAELPWVEILERVSYEELFRTYAGAIAAVVPLKAGLTYPSGIRAVCEGILLGKPVIATRTPVLEESFEEGKGVWFVPAQDPTALRGTLERIRDDPAGFERLMGPARDAVCVRSSMSAFTSSLEAILQSLVATEP